MLVPHTLSFIDFFKWSESWCVWIVTFLVAVLITGGTMGGSSGKLRTAELFLPSAGTSCGLPLFPEITRQSHTLDNNIICGGEESRDTCLKWSPDTGSWVELLTLAVDRYQHVTWTPEPGMGSYLMGGKASPTTTTLIKDDGTQEPAFQLKYGTA